MKTALINDPNEAARIIRSGGIVAFPTETVYGLGANVFDEAAIAKIFIAKGRPQDNPLIAHIGRVDDLACLTDNVTESASRFIEIFFPGPLTLVLPKHHDVPLIATAGLATIGVRMPHHALAREFLRACDVPVVAPSANLSGRPSPTTWQAVKEDLDGRIDAILCGEQTEVGLESTVVDCTGPEPIVLRAGAVTLEQLRIVIPSTRVADAASDSLVRSPGTRHRHYSPQAQVILVDSPEQALDTPSSAFIGFASAPPIARANLHRVCATLDDYAHELFLFFRDCDSQGVKRIYCQTVPAVGIGRAIMDRLRRAADEKS